MTIMLARGELDIEADMVVRHRAAARRWSPGCSTPCRGVRALRDATRGGVATILNEIAKAAEVAVVVDEARDAGAAPRSAARRELLGIDPLYVACEGRFVAVVDGASADAALAALRAHPLGERRRRDRPGQGRPARAGPAQHDVRRHPDRRPAGRRPATRIC